MLCALESPPATYVEITEEQIRAAIDVAMYCRASMLWVTRGWSGNKPLYQQSAAMTERRIEAHLQQHGCADELTLIKALHLGGDECKRAVFALVETGVVSVGLEQRPRKVHLLTSCKCGVVFNG